MKIGIVSDSHGRYHVLQLAIDMLVKRGATKLLHCGDIGSFECLELLGQAGVEAYAVAGNVDDDIYSLERAAQEWDVHLGPAHIEIALTGKARLAATHGNDAKLLDKLIASGRFAYVCHGHTHRLRDQQIGDVRVINPGSLFASRDVGFPTACILDTASQTLDIVHVRQE